MWLLNDLRYLWTQMMKTIRDHSASPCHAPCPALTIDSARLGSHKGHSMGRDTVTNESNESVSSVVICLRFITCRRLKSNRLAAYFVQIHIRPRTQWLCVDTPVLRGDWWACFMSPRWLQNRYREISQSLFTLMDAGLSIIAILKIYTSIFIFRRYNICRIY